MKKNNPTVVKLANVSKSSFRVNAIEYLDTFRDRAVSMPINDYEKYSNAKKWSTHNVYSYSSQFMSNYEQKTK